jgi:hypothetical protein
MTRPTDPPTDRALEEHADLRGVLARTGEIVSGYPPKDRELPWLEEVLDDLERLRTTLAAHFEHEESSGMFESIEEEFPAASRECRDLLAEHDVILADLEKIREDGRGMLERQESPRGFNDRVLELIQVLRDHEARENDLLYLSIDGGPQAQD